MSCKLEKIEDAYFDETIKNGYMQVKLPPNLRGIVSQWKAWNKKWIEIKFDDNNIDKNNISIKLSVFRNEKSGVNGLQNIIYQQSFQSRNAVIFRCGSRTQSYAFTICSIDNAEQAIHLAGVSESNCQIWMKCLRESLWPSNPLMKLENLLKGHFYVSIIDNEKSHRAGLLGAYGYLQVSAKKLILTHPQSGHVIEEWNLSSFVLENPFDYILEIVPNKSSFSDCGNIFFYCNDANEVIKRTNREKQILKFVEGYELKENISYNSTSLPKSLNNFQNLNLNSDIENFFNRTSFSYKSSKNNSIDCNTFRIRTAEEIPETMLNCSFSSPNMNSLINHMINYDNSENIYSEPFNLIENEDFESEDMEKIYEEIVIKECASHSWHQCLNDSCPEKTQFDEDLPPELPPKNIITSNPIMIQHNSKGYLNGKFSREEESKSFLGNEICSYDMFSTIVKQTHISLIYRQNLLNKSSKLASNALGKENNSGELDNDYCEMRSISTKPIDMSSNYHNDYVDMRSFSI